MPELPEVHTTVEGLKKVLTNKTIKDMWSDFHIGTTHGHRQTIKNTAYLKNFRERVLGKKIKSVERLGKNILIHLDNKNTIVIHMKMTGHLMYGKYRKIKSDTLNKKEKWEATEEGPLQDSYNQFLHFVLSLDDGEHLVLSDMRKFASVCIVETGNLNQHEGLSLLGPDPTKNLSFKEFSQRILSKKDAPIKKTLLDQTVIAGIGNIYSDEILWASSVHPLSKSGKIDIHHLKLMFKNTKSILAKSIKLGGDSMSDYRNAFGEKGGFQNCHKAYRQTGKNCSKAKCRGIIEKMVIAGRSSHFCNKHQKLFK